MVFFDATPFFIQFYEIMKYTINSILLSLLILLPASSFAEKVKAKTHAITKLFEIKGTTSFPLELPSDVAVNSRGIIFIVDGVNNRISAYDKKGLFLQSFGNSGSGGDLSAPVGLGISSNDDVFVADKNNKKIQIFSSAGIFKRNIDLSNLEVSPIDVAIDKNGNCYITDNRKHRVVVYNAEGAYLRQWGSRGEEDLQFRYPATITIDNNLIYITDAINTRISVYKPNGQYIRQIGSWGVLAGELFRPKGVAADSKGRIYVSDSYMDLIEVFSGEGRFLYVLGDKGGNIQRFTAPGGIFIKDNILYVTEMLEDKISVYSLN